MLHWPDNPALPASVRGHLERLRASGVLMELQADADRWIFEALPWSDEYPIRIGLRNARFEPLEVVIDDDGLWRFVRPAEVPRFSAQQA